VKALVIFGLALSSWAAVILITLGLLAVLR